MKKLVIILILIFSYVSSQEINFSSEKSVLETTTLSTNNEKTNNTNKSWISRLHLPHTKWEEFGPFFAFTMFIVITGLTKIGFYHVKFIVIKLPESCLLIISGAILGAIIRAAGIINTNTKIANETTASWPILPSFTPTLFFAVLLPPVILESAYLLYDRQFANNLTTVLLFAVIGTVFNAFSFGFLLYAIVNTGAAGTLTGVIEEEGFVLSLVDCLLFGCIAAAVDPVAVLAIFHELGVNKELYFLLFGESLLNDAVTVALYSNIVHFSQVDNIEGAEYGFALFTLFGASIGGAFLGAMGGLITALVTRLTRKSRVVEPLAVLGFAYLSYLIAELLHFSSIISILSCGLLQSHYALKNISNKSFTTVKYFTKMISSVSDSAIFLFLGAALVGEIHSWHIGFIAWSLFLCLFCRIISIFVLSAIKNAISEHGVELKNQMILSYGGLRGAVCFALARMLDEAYPPNDLFATTALAIVLFTVFIQGTTIQWLIEILKIEKKSNDRKTLNQEIVEHVARLMIAGMEEIARARGNYYIQRKLHYIDQHYLKKIFMNPEASNDIKLLFERISLLDHFDSLYTRRDTMVPVASRQFAATPEPTELREKTLFLRTFGLLTAHINPNLYPREWHDRSDSLQSAFDGDSPFEQFEDRLNREAVIDRPRDFRQILRLRRNSILNLGRTPSTGPSISIIDTDNQLIPYDDIENK